MLNYSNVAFRYEPFPIGCIHNIFDQETYQALLDEWPPMGLFNYRKENGEKYSLSGLRDVDKLQGWLEKSPAYKRFHDHIQSREFTQDILALLKRSGIDLGYLTEDGTLPKPKRAGLLSSLTGHTSKSRSEGDLKCRFEFSAMPVTGGSIRPHTDTPRKIVTMVFSILSPNEWDPAFGGGTQVVMPKDPKKIYNQLNHYLEFEDVTVIDEFPFVANQAVIFIKTYNSWHAVEPMRGKGAKGLRRSLTLNIEDMNIRKSVASKGTGFDGGMM